MQVGAESERPSGFVPHGDRLLPPLPYPACAGLKLSVGVGSSSYLCTPSTHLIPRKHCNPETLGS